ncbi:hypothetical protein BJY01DRAFT_246985 [Aspergillus pseudoustus]|uniref:Hydrophobic surface binding protein A-domain-containing protein n=1 Tax=Aspergillus pseudoustus TaxID=1810923 RepID=A0ABR4K3M2_9EURO
MKLTTLWLSTTALLSTSIQAARISRDNNPTSALLTLLTSKLTTLNTAISSYTGDDDDADVFPIQSASNALIITIDRGLRDISAGPDLSTPEAQALSPQLEALATSSKATISALVEKIPLFVSSSSSSSSNICNSASVSLAKALHNQYAVWDKLFTLVSSKVPEKQAGVVAGFANRILASTQEGVDAFVNTADTDSSDCSPAPLPPARIELRSYSGSGNSSTPGGNTTSPTTTTTSPTTPSQTTVPSSPAFTGAAAALTVAVGDGAMKMVGMGVIAVAVAVAL